MMTSNGQSIVIDLSDLEIEEVEVLMQEGSRGMSDFAASCCTCTDCCTGSCGSKPKEPVVVAGT